MDCHDLSQWNGLKYLLLLLYVGLGAASYAVEIDSSHVLALDYSAIKELRYQQTDKATRDLLASLYLQKAKQEQNQEQIGWGYLLMYASHKSDTIGALYVDSCITLAEGIHHYELLVEAYIRKGLINYRHGELVKALDNYEHAQSIARSKGLDGLYQYIELCKAWLLILNDQDHLAVPTFEQTLAYFDTHQLMDKWPGRYCAILEALSLSYSFLEQFDEARAVIAKAISISDNACPHFKLKFKYIHTDLEILLQNGEAVIPELIELRNSWVDTLNPYYFDIQRSITEALLQAERTEQAALELNRLEELCKDMTPIDRIHYLQDLYHLFSDYYIERQQFEPASVYLQKKAAMDSLAGYVESDFLHEMQSREQRADDRRSPQWKTKPYMAVLIILPIGALIGLYLWQMKKASKAKKEKCEKAQESARPSVDQETLEAIKQRLIGFEQSQIYLHKQYNRASLATQLKTNTTYLSIVLRQYKGMSFSTYMKKLRIEAITEIIQEQERYRLMTIEAIAQEFGYSSGRTLSKAFREVNKYSLSDYIKSIN